MPHEFRVYPHCPALSLCVDIWKPFCRCADVDTLGSGMPLCYSSCKFLRPLYSLSLSDALFEELLLVALTDKVRLNDPVIGTGFARVFSHACKTLGVSLNSPCPATSAQERIGLHAASYQKFISNMTHEGHLHFLAYLAISH